MAYNTVFLKGDFGRRYDEKRADGAITPGHLLQVTSAGKWKAHQTRGGKWNRAVAVEDALSGIDGVNTKGNTIDDAYADGNLVRGVYCEPGDKIYALLAVGENVAIGDWGISYGDGTVCKAATAFLANNVTASVVSPAGTDETAFSTGTVTIPANTLKVGDVIRIRGHGLVVDQNSTDTLLIKVKIGTDILVASATVDVGDNDVFVFDVTAVIRTIGATGTFVAHGAIGLGAPITATMRADTIASTTIDTTAAATLTVTYTWSASHADNDVQLDSLIVEHVKAGSSVANGSAGGEVIGTFDTAVDNSLGEDPARVVVEVR